MAPLSSAATAQFNALIDGEIRDRALFEQSFYRLATAIWRERQMPDLSVLRGIQLRRAAYILETIRLFTRDRELREVLNQQIRIARRNADQNRDKGDLLPAAIRGALADPSDTLAAFWGLSSGIKVHKISGFLTSYYSLQNPASIEQNAS